MIRSSTIAPQISQVYAELITDGIGTVLTRHYNLTMGLSKEELDRILSKALGAGKNHGVPINDWSKSAKSEQHPDPEMTTGSPGIELDQIIKNALDAGKNLGQTINYLSANPHVTAHSSLEMDISGEGTELDKAAEGALGAGKNHDQTPNPTTPQRPATYFIPGSGTRAGSSDSERVKIVLGQKINGHQDPEPALLLPRGESHEGFLEPGQKLREIILRDYDVVKRLSDIGEYGYLGLASIVSEFIQTIKNLRKSEVSIGANKFLARYVSYPGSQNCPWNESEPSPGDYFPRAANEDVALTPIGGTIPYERYVSDLLPHLIFNHKFFEGNKLYRLSPEEIVQLDPRATYSQKQLASQIGQQFPIK